MWFATHFVDLARILSERNGVVSLHLAVEVCMSYLSNINLISIQISQDDAMRMLYKVVDGAAKKSHYGLTLASVVPLPPGVIECATFVVQKLERQVQKREKISNAVFKERRRKLILNLKEHLVQAQNGIMEGSVLTAWLKGLQKEFVFRMAAIDAEAAAVGEQGEGEDEDKEMRDRSRNDKMDIEGPDQPNTHSSRESVPSVIALDSHITSTESDSTTRAISENGY